MSSETAFFDDPGKLLKESSMVNRFLEYVKINTASDEKSDRAPSTDSQRRLAEKLVNELLAMAVPDAGVDENGYVTATVQGNAENHLRVGLIAHLDTSPDAPSDHITPVFHNNYDGSPIRLKGGLVLDVPDNPHLADCLGDTLITSDGTTLLGADDKAGIAEIMALVEFYRTHPTVPHPTLCIGFTPDEEIGRGAHKFPIKRFNADVAFTLDGGARGEINIETFNAQSAYVKITGIPAHPGTAKGRMVNALRHMGRFLGRLPTEISPECTDGREGFIHPYELDGDAGESRCHLILRDFERENLAQLGRTIRKAAAEIMQEEPRLNIEVDFVSSYPNMHDYLKDKPEIAERLVNAVFRSGLTPTIKPIRGGTDGATLTRMGLPCPNIFCGGMNVHSQSEWISTRSMGYALCTVLNLMLLYAR